MGKGGAVFGPMKLGHANTAMLEKHYAHQIEEAKLVPRAQRVSFEDAIDALRAVSDAGGHVDEWRRGAVVEPPGSRAEIRPRHERSCLGAAQPARLVDVWREDRFEVVASPTLIREVAPGNRLRSLRRIRMSA